MTSFELFSENTKIILLFVKFILGAAAVVPAVIAWRKTDEPSEILFIMSILTLYLSILCEILNYFGFITIRSITGFICILIIDSIPILLFTASLICLIRRK